MRLEGLEPPRRKAHAPKACVSTSSTTAARMPSRLVSFGSSRDGAPSIAQEDLALEQIAMRFYLISLIRMVESKETDSNDGNKNPDSTDRLILFVTRVSRTGLAGKVTVPPEPLLH